MTKQEDKKMKKYELTNETKQIEGRTLHRIKALIDFGNVKTGDLGGFIEKEENLSHSGLCWISDKALVCDNALVRDNAKISGCSVVCGNTSVRDNAKISDYAIAGDNAKISGNAWVRDNAKVSDNAWVCGNTRLLGHAFVCDNSKIWDEVLIGGESVIGGDSLISGKAHISGEILISGNTYISGNAQIFKKDDYSTIQNFGTEYRNITFFRQRDGSIGVNCQKYDCFDEDYTSFDTINGFREYTSIIMNEETAKEYFAISDLMENYFSKEEMQEWDVWYDEDGVLYD